MERKQTGVLSILSLIFGIIGLVTSLIIIGFLPSAAGLILGIVALSKREKIGMPIAGVVCSALGVIIALVVLFSPSPTPSGTVSNKDSAQIETDEPENLADMIEHKIYAMSSIDCTTAYVLVTNNADVPIDVSTNVSALDTSGTVLGAYSSSETCIAPGQSCPVYHYFDGISIDKIADYDYSVTVTRSSYESIVDADLDWKIENTTENGVIIKVTNNHDYDIYYLSAYAMCFKNGKLVGYGSTYIDNVESDCILQSGATVTEQIDCYLEGDFDNVEVYLNGRKL